MVSNLKMFSQFCQDLDQKKVYGGRGLCFPRVSIMQGSTVANRFLYFDQALNEITWVNSVATLNRLNRPKSEVLGLSLLF